jgi:hypothetical protein
MSVFSNITPSFPNVYMIHYIFKVVPKYYHFPTIISKSSTLAAQAVPHHEQHLYTILVEYNFRHDDDFIQAGRSSYPCYVDGA